MSVPLYIISWKHKTAYGNAGRGTTKLSKHDAEQTDQHQTITQATTNENTAIPAKRRTISTNHTRCYCRHGRARSIRTSEYGSVHPSFPLMTHQLKIARALIVALPIGASVVLLMIIAIVYAALFTLTSDLVEMLRSFDATERFSMALLAVVFIGAASAAYLMWQQLK